MRRRSGERLQAGLPECGREFGGHRAAALRRQAVESGLHALLRYLQRLVPYFANLVGSPRPAFAEQRRPFGFFGREYRERQSQTVALAMGIIVGHCTSVHQVAILQQWRARPFAIDGEAGSAMPRRGHLFATADKCASTVTPVTGSVTVCVRRTKGGEAPDHLGALGGAARKESERLLTYHAPRWRQGAALDIAHEPASEDQFQLGARKVSNRLIVPDDA
jgi:hypothetical protein